MKRKTLIGGFKTPIWKACSNDGLRPALQHAYVKDGYIYATNAHIAIRQSLSAIHEIPAEQIAVMDGKFFSVPLLKALEKFNMVEFRADGIECTSHGTRAVYRYSEEPGKYPNVDAVIPSTESRQNVARIGFDPILLKRLTEVMSSDLGQFALEFYGKSKAIVVTSANHTRAAQLGILMPVILKD